jgi:Zn-finger protein
MQLIPLNQCTINLFAPTAAPRLEGFAGAQVINQLCQWQYRYAWLVLGPRTNSLIGKRNGFQLWHLCFGKHLAHRKRHVRHITNYERYTRLHNAVELRKAPLQQLQALRFIFDGSSVRTKRSVHKPK